MKTQELIFSASVRLWLDYIIVIYLPVDTVEFNWSLLK